MKQLKARVPKGAALVEYLVEDRMRKRLEVHVSLYTKMSLWVLARQFGFGSIRCQRYIQGWNGLLAEIDKEPEYWSDLLDQMIKQELKLDPKTLMKLEEDKNESKNS